MKEPHNILKNESIIFKHFGELDAFAEKHPYKKGEFEFVSLEPLTMKKVS
jgi:hypothetical protein